MAHNVLKWLLNGDVSIGDPASKDLVPASIAKLDTLQSRIEREGWGKKLLQHRNPNGHWGQGSYQPKWTSTHYTLLQLREMGISPHQAECRQSTALLLGNPVGKGGGINIFRSIEYSDVCVNGMLLNMAGYFMPESPVLRLIVDYLLDTAMRDGGWNCEYDRGARHSSLHTTISVLEGFDCHLKSKKKYRAGDIRSAIDHGVKFLLRHRLFRSHRTGAIIDPRFLRLTYPSRWRYDILRALDCLRSLNWRYDSRMQDAIDLVLGKQGRDGKWTLAAAHPGRVHFEMEKTGQPSRWNTLRAMRVLIHFGAVNPNTIG